MTPQERMRLAQGLRKRANSQPNVTQAQRQEARRVASNLVALNTLDAMRKKRD